MSCPRPLVVLLVMVAACTPTSPPTTTSSPTSTGPTTTPTTASSCDLADLPAEASDLTTALDADYDGDGAADPLSTYLLGGAWVLRLELTTDGGSEEVIAGADPLAPARPIGGFDVDGDRTPEAFLTVGSGAATVLVALYRLDGCGLLRITSGGGPAVFPIGATVGNVSGLTCHGAGDIDRVFASTSDGVTYEGGSEPFQLEGTELVAGTGDGASITADEAGALAQLDCGTLSLP